MPGPCWTLSPAPASSVRVRAKWEEQFHGCFASSQAGGGGEPGSGEVLPPPQRWVSSASPPSSSRGVASTRSSPHCRNWTFFILLFLQKREKEDYLWFLQQSTGRRKIVASVQTAFQCLLLGADSFYLHCGASYFKKPTESSEQALEVFS